MSASYKYTSKDRLFEVNIGEQNYNMMRELCGKFHPKETGGILLGYYSNNQHAAIITKVIGPSRDSKHGVSWFKRGTQGLQNVIDGAWEKEQIYYLGEWHYHPKNFPSPSSIDINQMKRISKSPEYHCPEPILIIVNGGANKNICVYVFPSNKNHIQLELL